MFQFEVYRVIVIRQSKDILMKLNKFIIISFFFFLTENAKRINQ